MATGCSFPFAPNCSCEHDCIACGVGRRLGTGVHGIVGNVDVWSWQLGKVADSADLPLRGTVRKRFRPRVWSRYGTSKYRAITASFLIALGDRSSNRFSIEKKLAREMHILYLQYYIKLRQWLRCKAFSKEIVAK